MSTITKIKLANNMGVYDESALPEDERPYKDQYFPAPKSFIDNYAQQYGNDLNIKDFGSLYETMYKDYATKQLGFSEADANINATILKNTFFQEGMDVASFRQNYDEVTSDKPTVENNAAKPPEKTGVVGSFKKGYHGEQAAQYFSDYIDKKEIAQQNLENHNYLESLVKKGIQLNQSQQMTYDSKGLLKDAEQLKKQAQESFANYLEAEQQFNAIPTNEGVAEFGKQKGFIDSAGYLVSHPSATANLFAQSAYPMSKQVGAMTAGGLVGGMPGAVLATGIVSKDINYDSKLMESAQQGSSLDDAKADAQHYSTVVAAGDMASLGAAKYVKPFTSKFGNVATQALVVQPVIAGGTEAAAQYNTYGKIASPNDVVAEGFLEILPGTLETAVATRGDTKLKPNIQLDIPDIKAGANQGSSLSALIASGEGGYGSYNQGHAGDAQGATLDFGQLTIGEVQRRQNLAHNDSNYLFAVGKYQIIPSTLDAAVKALNLPADTPFTPAVQEHIYAQYLTKAKRPQIEEYITGTLDDNNAAEKLKSAQLALAQEWASVADPNTGRSYHGGIGNNKASITAEQAANALNQARNDYQAAISKGIDHEVAWAQAIGGVVVQQNVNAANANIDASPLNNLNTNNQATPAPATPQRTTEQVAPTPSTAPITPPEPATAPVATPQRTTEIPAYTQSSPNNESTPVRTNQGYQSASPQPIETQAHAQSDQTPSVGATQQPIPSTQNPTQPRAPMSEARPTGTEQNTNGTTELTAANPTITFNPSEQGGTNSPRYNIAPRAANLTGQDTPLTSAWKLIASQEDAFQLPLSSNKTLASIAADYDPQIKVNAGVETKDSRLWTIQVPTKNGIQSATVIEGKGRDKTIHLDISQFEQGNGGRAVYQMVGDYAHNTGKVFIGDPNGLSEIAQVRRTENMLSSALRRGTTDHLQPHELQLKPDAKGITPLQWKHGNTEFNLDQMLRVSASNLSNQIPELRQIRYNFDSQQFEATDENGRTREYLDADFEALAQSRGARATQAGRTTLKRAAITNTLLSEEGQTGWHGILGALVRQSSQQLDPALKDILYHQSPTLDQTIHQAADQHKLPSSAENALLEVFSSKPKSPQIAERLLREWLAKNHTPSTEHPNQRAFVTANMAALRNGALKNVSDAYFNQGQNNLRLADNVERNALSEAKAEAAIKRILGSTPFQNRIPERLLASAGSAAHRVKGVTYNNTIYIDTRKMASIAEAEAIAIEELTHIGATQFFGESYTARLEALHEAMGGERGIKRFLAKHNISMADDYFKMDKATQADELLAHVEAHQTSLSRRAKMAFQRVIGYIRQQLRKLGARVLPNVSDSDIILLARRVREAATSAPKATQTTQASFSIHPSQSEFEQTAQQYGGQTAWEQAKQAGQTKLNYRQWVQVRTPTFKQWFGEWEHGSNNQASGNQASSAHARRGSDVQHVGRPSSDIRGFRGELRETHSTRTTTEEQQGRANRVGDMGGRTGQASRLKSASAKRVALHPETGEPLVFYHGTNETFYAFDLNHPNKKDAGWLGHGVYLSSEPTIAKAYATGKVKRNGGNPQIMSLFAAVKNPYIASLTEKQTLSKATQAQIDQWTEHLKQQSHDGVMMEAPQGVFELVAFTSNQVKSATNNTGTFSATHDDIRYHIGQNNAAAVHEIENLKALHAQRQRRKGKLQRYLKTQYKTWTDRKLALSATLFNSQSAERKAAIQWAKRNFYSDSILGRDIADAKRGIDWANAETSDIITSDIPILEAVIEAAYGKHHSELTHDEQQQLHEALTGKITFPNQTIQANINLFRERIDNASRELINEKHKEMRMRINELSPQGLALLQQYAAQWTSPSYRYDPEKETIPAALAHIHHLQTQINTITGNLGQYLHRSYQAFTDPKWVDKVKRKPIYQQAIDYIQQDRGISRDQAEGKLNAWLESTRSHTNMISFGSGNAKDEGIMKQRKEIPPVLRAVLGEFTDPVYNYANTIAQTADYVAHSRYQMMLRQLLLSMPDIATIGEASGNKSAQFPPEQGYSALRDLYIDPEFLKELQAFNLASPLSEKALLQGMVSLSAAVKLGKTIGAPTTQMRNFWSGFLLLAQAGHSPFGEFIDTYNLIKQAKHRVNPITGNLILGKKEAMELNQKYVRLGVRRDGASSGELEKIFNDFHKMDTAVREQGLLRKSFGLLIRSYQFSDDFFKIIHFEKGYADLIKTGMSPAQAELEAARRTRDTMPTYSMIPRWVKTLRQFPLIAPFVAFPYEQLRTLKNNITYMAGDMQRYRETGNKQWLLMAGKRATGLAVGFALPSIAVAASMMALGIEDEDDDAIDHFSSDWRRGQLRLYTGSDEHGLSYIDLTSLVPSEYVMRAIRQGFLTGEAEGAWAGLVEGALTLGKPYYQWDIANGGIINIANNYDPNNDRPIYGEGKTLADLISHPVENAQHWDELFAYTSRQFGPGVMQNINDFSRALAGTVGEADAGSELLNEYAAGLGGNLSRSGKQFTEGDAVAALLGLRVTTQDTNLLGVFASGQTKNKLASYSAEFKQALDTTIHISPDFIDSRISQVITDRERAYDKMRDLIRYYQKKNYSDAEIVDFLYEKNQTLGKEQVRQLVKGKTPIFEPSKDLMSRSLGITDRISNPTERYQAKKALAERYRYIIRQAREMQQGEPVH